MIFIYDELFSDLFPHLTLTDNRAATKMSEHKKSLAEAIGAMAELGAVFAGEVNHLGYASLC